MGVKLNPYIYSDLFFSLDKGIHALTEEAIYNSLKNEGELIPIWGGQQSHEEESQFISSNAKNKEGRAIRIFDGDCLIVSLDGSAGSMTYKPEKINGRKLKFTLNHHAGVLRCKNNKLIDLEYFKYRYEDILRGLAVSDGSKTITIKMLESQVYELPDKPTQLDLLKRYKKLDTLRLNIIDKKRKAKKIFRKTLSCSFINNITDFIPLNEIIEYKSRNDCLSEEGIYNNLPDFGSENSITVLCGSSGNINYGSISSSTPAIHSLANRQGLHVVTRGRAGKLTYLKKGDYATNTNAFIFYLRTDKFNQIKVTDEKQEEIYLNFLKVYLQPIFYDICSKSDLSVFPLTNIAISLQIPFFKYCQQMKKIVEKYAELETYLYKYDIMLHKIDVLIKKQIV